MTPARFACSRCGFDVRAVGNAVRQLGESLATPKLATSDDRRTLGEAMRDHCLAALSRNEWRMAPTARELHVNRTTLYRWVKLWNMDDPSRWPTGTRLFSALPVSEAKDLGLATDESRVRY